MFSRGQKLRRPASARSGFATFGMDLVRWFAANSEWAGLDVKEQIDTARLR
jgi:hypothetical protein